VHDVVDHFTDLLLILLKHLDLALHKLSLAVHQRLWNDVHVLRLKELLPHLVQESIHLLIR